MVLLSARVSAQAQTPPAAQPVAKAAAAAAQETPAGAALQEVVVTGSRLITDPSTAPTPLIQISRADVLEGGQSNVIDVLADVPALSGSIVPEDTTGSGLNDGGLSLLNLRDLGTNRTLTLVDGRRHVGSVGGSLSVDIDTIPRLLIERVEIVTGANSAQYGADAVSGVVNFIQRRDFEGIEADVALAQINKAGQTNQRASLLAGHNFFDGRLNVYGSYEHEENEEVRDADIDWRREAWGLLARDFDPASAPNDGVPDNILISGIRNLSRSRGGTLALVTDIGPDPARNISNARCTAGGANNSINANCIVFEPGNTWQFDSSGVARPANFGTIRNNVGRTRSLNVGGDGLNVNTEFSQGSRLPEASADRIQGGFNFDLTDNLELFGEVKYVEEETFDDAQQTFFDIGVVGIAAGANSPIFGTSSFNIGLDNAYLDPAVRSAILANQRPTFNAAGVQTGTTPDARARLSIFGPNRTQLNQKELKRFVVGTRGTADKLGFVSNLNYEVGFTHGELNNVNYERAVDVIRFKHSVDAVRDTAGIVNGKAGEIVCRVKLLAAQGIAIPDQLRGGNYSPTNPEVAGCVPSRVFGDGGYNEAAFNYFDATINVREKNTQDDALAFVSGNLWDFWGAGAIGLVLGTEWRKETTQAIGRSTSTGDRLLFLNTGADFPKVDYKTTELFTEMRVPLLKGKFLAESLDLGGAYRQSDYTTVGKNDTYNTNVVWRPISDITFRATMGRSVRVPNLGENFRPATQTFANGFSDPCSLPVINATVDSVIRANRIKNCAAIGIPAGTTITYTGGVPGKNAGNPFLKPETSYTRTLSMIVTPRFLPAATVVVDYYKIEIKDVIASVTAQALANQCVDRESVNPGACNLITRAGAGGTATGAPYAMIDFLQGSLNYAKFTTEGVDFQFLYGTDLPSVGGTDLGRLSYRLSGNFLMDNSEYTNIANPSERFEYERLVGFPRLRFKSTVDWEMSEKLSLRWSFDWQKEQTLVDARTLAGNDDVYEDALYYTTGSFISHDFSVGYAPIDGLLVRGGVVNAFDKKPARWMGNTSADNFDLFGRRFFIGLNYKL